MNFERIKDSAACRCGEIIAALTPLSAEVIHKKSTDHPCPVCGGRSVIWPANDAKHTGSIACRTCTDNRPTGDIIGTVAKFGGHDSQGSAARAIASYLGIELEESDSKEPPDIVEAVAKAKRMPIDAFRKFGAEPAKRGRSKTPVARVPVYNESGEIHSHFDMTSTDKGFFKRGRGSSGLFFPGELPKPGETWCLVEGVKDAATLLAHGFHACGLPGASLARKYAGLFKGVHVITVADLDEPGQDGAVKTGGNLAGIAASVKATRLPGEIVKTKGDDVRDVIRRDGIKAARKAIENAEVWKPRDAEQYAHDERPEVIITLRYAWHVDQVTQHLGRLGWESSWIPAKKRESRKLYQRGGLLVDIVDEIRADATTKGGKVAIARGTPRIRSLPSQQLPLRIADACELIREVEDKEGNVEKRSIPPPKWLVDGVYTRGDYGDAIRPLEGVVTAPTIRMDGSILQVAGYDKKTGLVYRPSMKFVAVASKPTKNDAAKASKTLLDVVSDFPFTEDADRAAWIAMVLSMIGRPCVAGQVPLFAITANVRGCGKSMLVDVGSIIAYGHIAARTSYSSDDNEMRKRITAIAIEAAPAVLLDNIDRPIGGASLDAVLTAGRWKDRELGQSRNVDLPIRTIWTATGNNLSFRSDIARRVLPIRLESPLERPEDRNDFEHSDLLKWTHENRAGLVSAALTILRGYFVDDCPKQPGGQWGSFESWSDVVRGAVLWSGLSDPLPTRKTASEDDESAGILRGLIGGLIEIDEAGDGVTCSEIVRKLAETESAPEKFKTMRDTVAELMTKPDARRLGQQLKKHRRRVANGFHIIGHPGHGGVLRWSAVPHGGKGGFGGSSPTASSSARLCVSHTDDQKCDTHTYLYGDALESNPPNPPNPPCPDCAGVMVPSAMEINGYRNLDCIACGKVIPQRTEANP